jgi:hypothetical protein
VPGRAVTPDAPLDRLVIVDTGSTDDSVRIAASRARIRQVVGNVEAISAPHESTFGDAVGKAVVQITNAVLVETGASALASCQTRMAVAVA